MVDVLANHVNVTLVGVANIATRNYVTHGAMNMDNVKMVHVCALPAGMENTVRWKVAPRLVPIMVNVVLAATDCGNVDVMMVGTVQIVP